MEKYLVINKNEILPFEAAWVYLEGIKWNKSDRERQMLYYFSYVDIKKNKKKNKNNKRETELQI